ncbi:MAG: prepilin-type N-terminal cleavage/methylation domain-containing protein, partial [Colwellia sp.]|nr:prepilin-type N-terminal cleavage/methylation domain-containing protein [Colwellia sp.]
MRLSTFGNTQQVNTQPVSKQQGFTLIELVVVIVILGILAVTAAPKFIDLTSDAKGSVVQAVKASINSAADMAHAKA